jgi:hypothetical protein
MESLTKKKPASVTAIGWVFIVSAILMILSGVFGFIAYRFIQQMGVIMPPPMSEEILVPFRILTSFLKYFGLLAFSQIIFAIFILIASIQFLKLRAWARTALEVVSWLSLVYIVGFGIFGVIAWLNMTPSLPVEAESIGPLARFNILGAIMGIAVIVVSSISFIVIIKFLRGTIIREAMHR